MPSPEAQKAVALATAMDRATRLDGLRASLESDELDGIIVTKATNIRWLCGFTGSNGVLAVGPKRAVLVTDGRYTEQADEELSAAEVDVDVEIDRDVFGPLPTSFGSGDRVGFEAGDLSFADHERLQSVLGAVSMVATSATIETLRQSKDEGEIARLRAAAAMADHAFASLVARLTTDLEPDLSERRFGADLDHAMRVAGADDISFETIVGSGRNAALPHARPSDKRIERGDLVVLDFGASVDGYGSDMTRTVVAGGEPTPDQAELYDAVATAQRLGVEAVAAGVAESDVDRACRQALDASGLGDKFIHGTGHGIGLEIHEAPFLSARSVGILRAGLVVTVEPGAYLPGFGGVRVEDSVVVTADGCDPITQSPKGLVPSFAKDL